jgi:DNA modification methylase
MSLLATENGIKPYYQDDAVTLYHGDCREILPTLGRFDLLLTDPPYGIGESTGKNRNSSNLGETKDYGFSEWDLQPPSKDLIASLLSSSSVAILWGGNYYEGLPPSRCWLVWDKDNTGMRADAELAWTNRDAAVRLFKWKWNGMLQEQMGDKKEPRFHPTQKPIALMRWCLSFAPDATTILDPFAGSGTTGVAAKLEGRKATLIEMEERYCEIAANRLSQGVLF